MKADSQSVGTLRYDLAAFIMERKVVKGKSRHSVKGEAFIENGRTVKTIGRLAIAVMTRSHWNVSSFFFYLDMCIHVKEMSTKCQKCA